jgi:hypothetical protein
MNQIFHPAICIVYLLYILCPFCLDASAHAGNTLVERHYLETTGEKQKNFSWVLANEEGWLLTAQDQQETHRAWLKDDFSTVRWNLVSADKSTDISVSRQGNRLHIKGILDGETCDRTLELNDKPWLQALSISLRTLLEDSDQNREFWMLRPDNLDLHLMQVSEVRATDLPFNGSTLPAWQVEIRPTGWKTYLWSAHYWFRQSDLCFLKYEGVSGPPGSPMTTIILNEETELIEN